MFSFYVLAHLSVCAVGSHHPVPSANIFLAAHDRYNPMSSFYVSPGRCVTHVRYVRRALRVSQSNTDVIMVFSFIQMAVQQIIYKELSCSNPLHAWREDTDGTSATRYKEKHYKLKTERNALATMLWREAKTSWRDTACRHVKRNALDVFILHYIERHALMW